MSNFQTNFILRWNFLFILRNKFMDLLFSIESMSQIDSIQRGSFNRNNGDHRWMTNVDHFGWKIIDDSFNDFPIKTT